MRSITTVYEQQHEGVCQQRSRITSDRIPTRFVVLKWLLYDVKMLYQKPEAAMRAAVKTRAFWCVALEQVEICNTKAVMARYKATYLKSVYGCVKLVLHHAPDSVQAQQSGQYGEEKEIQPEWQLRIHPCRTNLLSVPAERPQW